MEIEKKVFKKYKPDFKKFEKMGCKKISDKYIIEKPFEDNNFKAVVSVNKEGAIEGKVIDLENNDEYLPLRNDNIKGAFVGKIRENYEKILLEIRGKYFLKNYFVLPQSNRITDLIFKKYKNEPEFLWEKSDGSGVFRNSKTDKWYGIIMDVDKSRIDKNQKGFIEVMNVKLSAKTLKESLEIDGFYPAYHMNKKYWITIILDETVDDNKIMELVEESYNLVDKK